ncbi:small multidrug efflux protein [Demequina sp. SO4-13]|uniref:small multidrug efflux protein n=1 Tax=Demequina sp. SO4-13 TaxID=3401027 RepID=UPI003AF78D05
MNPVEEIISSFQGLVAGVPEVVQPVIVVLAGAVPFVEGEGGAIIGVLGGLHPIIAAAAATLGNLASVVLVVAVTTRTRTAVVGHRRSLLAVDGGQGARSRFSGEAPPEAAVEKPESKGRQRFKRWVVRFGVPGASVLGPLAIPTQIMSVILVGGGTPRRWVLLWQAIAIVTWTTIATVSAWAALTVVFEVS